MKQLEQLERESNIVSKRFERSIINMNKDLDSIRDSIVDIRSKDLQTESWPPPPDEVAEISHAEDIPILTKNSSELRAMTPDSHSANSAYSDKASNEKCDILIVGDSIIKGIDPAKFHK